MFCSCDSNLGGRFFLIFVEILSPTNAGAVYQAANLGKGFKVKKFLVKEANIYPVQVCMMFDITANSGPFLNLFFEKSCHLTVVLLW